MNDIQAENQLPFAKRFLIYQKERFNFIENSLFLCAFSFSAISYSRICRGAEGFISLAHYLTAAITTILLFFLLRIADEFKDKTDDATYRPHLPVPRGLISFRELRWLAVTAILIILIVNILVVPQILLLLAIPIIFFLLMFKEFFVSKWLKKHWVVYVLSHMFFFPSIDMYSSGMDWYLDGGGHAPTGLFYFFAVSYMSGLVWEVGRKIKCPKNEEHNSYTRIYGIKKSVYLWFGIITLAYLFSLAAASNVNYGWPGYALLSVFYVSSIAYGVWFLFQQTPKLSKLIEVASGVWGLFMYLILGALPWVLHYFNGN